MAKKNVTQGMHETITKHTAIITFSSHFSAWMKLVAMCGKHERDILEMRIGPIGLEGSSFGLLGCWLCAGYLGHLFRNGHSENNYPNRLEQIVADTEICGS